MKINIQIIKAKKKANNKTLSTSHKKEETSVLTGNDMRLTENLCISKPPMNYKSPTKKNGGSSIYKLSNKSVCNMESFSDKNSSKEETYEGINSQILYLDSS